MSQRQDWRGHWPKGRRRNPPAPKGLISALRAYYRGAKNSAIIASACKADKKTVRYWLSGRWTPNPQQCRRIAKMGGMMISVIHPAMWPHAG